MLSRVIIRNIRNIRKNIICSFGTFGPPKDESATYIPNHMSPELWTNEEFALRNVNIRVKELHELLVNNEQKIDSQDEDDLLELLYREKNKFKELEVDICDLQKKINGSKDLVCSLKKHYSNDLSELLYRETHKFKELEKDMCELQKHINGSKDFMDAIKNKLIDV